MDATPVRVVICDDDALMRAAFETYIEAGDGLVLAGSYGSGAELLAALHEVAVDVLLLDVRMPEEDGPGLARRLATTHPRLKIIYLTSYPTDVPVVDALGGVVAGALTKDVPPATLTHAIHAARDGLTQLSPAFRALHKDAVAERIAGITNDPRDQSILRELSRGASTAEIAAALHVSESTVKQRLQVLVRQSGAGTRLALTLHLHGAGHR